MRMTLERFATRWTSPDYPPTLVDEHALAEAEASLGASLPADYRSAVLCCGLPRPTIALLDSIVESDLNVADLGDFLDPSSIVKITREWRDKGLPAELIAFANDSLGNLFCFSVRSDGGTSRVFFFDHEDGGLEEVASSFTAWIDELASLPEV
jgi:hypothetical protein